MNQPNPSIRPNTAAHRPAPRRLSGVSSTIQNTRIRSDRVMMNNWSRPAIAEPAVAVGRPMAGLPLTADTA
jgi:hypothetical protein